MINKIKKKENCRRVGKAAAVLFLSGCAGK